MILKHLICFLEKQDPDIICPIGFNNPHSYRGYYEQLAFEPVENILIRDMLKSAKEALNSIYTGYKGGEFLMDNYTSCHLAKYGYCGEEIGETLLKYMVGEL